MFIDDANALLERHEPLRRLTKLPEAALDDQYEDLKHQLTLLDSSCPRYDVFNVYSVLFPRLIKGSDSVITERNARAIEKRDELRKIASKAPLGAPWLTFCLEHRYSDQQRSAYLVRWNQDSRKYICTSMFDSAQKRNMIEFIPNAFEILLDTDDMFARFAFAPDLAGINSDYAKRGAEVVRICIELLNWDREDVPTMTYSDEKDKKTRRKKRQSASKKSSPTIIKFEPFLKDIVSRTHRASEDGRRSGGSAPGSWTLQELQVRCSEVRPQTRTWFNLWPPVDQAAPDWTEFGRRCEDPDWRDQDWESFE